MSLSPRATLTAALASALASAIRDNTGYHLDCGRRVLIGERRVNEAEAPCILLTPGPETPAQNAGPLGAVVIDYSITGYTNRLESPVPANTADPVAEYAVVDAVISDLRRAIDSAVCSLSSYSESLVYQGAVPIWHEEGGELCGARLRYRATTPYSDYIPGN